MQNKIIDNYLIYGKCVEFTANGIKLVVTVDIGPRIVYFGNEEINVMFNDLNNDISNSGEYFDNNFKKGECWKIWGGHRLWKSPEDMASYAPDNYPVKYNITNNSDSMTIELIAPTEKMTNLQKTVTITMFANGKVVINHQFKNNGKTNQQVSLWGLSVMAKNGVAIVPLSIEDTGLLANRNLVLWAYTDIKDPRFDLNNSYFTVKQDPTNTNAFKVGFINHVGVMAYSLKGGLFTKRYKFDDKASYPDYSCNAELYTNNVMLELESLSPLYDIESGATYNHIEEWSFELNSSIDYKAIADSLR